MEFPCFARRASATDRQVRTPCPSIRISRSPVGGEMERQPQPRQNAAGRLRHCPPARSGTGSRACMGPISRRPASARPTRSSPAKARPPGTPFAPWMTSRGTPCWRPKHGRAIGPTGAGIRPLLRVLRDAPGDRGRARDRTGPGPIPSLAPAGSWRLFRISWCSAPAMSHSFRSIPTRPRPSPLSWSGYWKRPAASFLRGTSGTNRRPGAICVRTAVPG